MSREERCEVTFIDEDRVREASARLVDGLAATRLAETFKALSDPTRVRIISAFPSFETQTLASGAGCRRPPSVFDSQSGHDAPNR